LENGKVLKEEIAPGIVVYSNVIPDSKSLYSDIEEGMISAKIEWKDAFVKNSKDVELDTTTRNTKTIGVSYSGKIDEIEDSDMSSLFFINLNNIFFEHFDPIEKDYLQSFGIGTTWHDSYGILKYGEGQFFTNHIDDHPDYHRRVSTLYYLNDNYSGGELNFPRFNLSFKPKANHMVVFPSTYVYNHSVSPVTEGERYAVVSWMK
jgi:Rps23 Pro-64 3,4-dihydroxylase Tpa1-like proline 4-hydroxylase